MVTRHLVLMYCINTVESFNMAMSIPAYIARVLGDPFTGARMMPSPSTKPHL